MGEELFEGSGIGEVAATFAGNAQFAAGLVHLFQQNHFCPLLGGSYCGHHAGGTGTHYDDLAHDLVRVKILSLGCTQSTGSCALWTICCALVPKKS